MEDSNACSVDQALWNRANRAAIDAQREQLLSMVDYPSPWQYVIHGETEKVRRAVAEMMFVRGKEKVAASYVMCGKGDVVVCGVEGKGCRVMPKRCGHRLCPRCSRWRGGQVLRKVLEHLAYFDHGELWSVVFTQRVIPGEKLEVSWERLSSAWSAMLQWLQRRGLVGGFIVFHVVRAASGNGWHVHAHAMLEFDGEMPPDLSESWNRTLERYDSAWTQKKPVWKEKLLDAGPATGECEDDGGDMFDDSKDPVVRRLQYSLRELMGGIEKYEGNAEVGFVAELFDVTEGKKMRRLLGEWRLGVEERALKLGVELPDSSGSAPAEEEVEMGTVDDVYYRAIEGERAAVQVLTLLEKGIRNNGSTARRALDMIRKVKVAA